MTGSHYLALVVACGVALAVALTACSKEELPSAPPDESESPAGKVAERRAVEPPPAPTPAPPVEPGIAIPEGTKILAVKFHADHCASCKAIDPHLRMATSKLAAEPIFFLTLDLTSPATQDQAKKTADSLGFKDIGIETLFVIRGDPV